MGQQGKSRLIRHFCKAAAGWASAAALFLSASGCTTTKWSGNPPPPNEQSIQEPLLTPSPRARPNISFERAPQTISQGILVDVDLALRRTNNFTVNRINFTGSKGTRENAYLTLPHGEGPFPLVVVFPVLSKSHSVSEVFGKELARNGYAVLRVEGYYLALDKVESAQQAMDRFRNTILDARILLDHVKKLPQIDEDKIATAGISLGSIMAATTMGIEPDIKAGAFILGGGELSEILHDSGQSTIEGLRRRVFEEGLLDIGTDIAGGMIHIVPGLLSGIAEHEEMTLAELSSLIKEIHKIETREDFINFTRPYTRPYDPVTYAGTIDSCRTMLLSGKYDRVIPYENTRALWEGLGEPEWNQVPSGHYDFALFFYWSADRTISLFDRVLKDEICEPENRPQLRR